LFNGLKISRKNSDGTESQLIDIPLSYSAREKWVSRLTGNPDLKRSTSMTLPRMAFELVSIEYDPARKLNSMNKFTNIVAGDTNTLHTSYSPVPYNLNFELYTVAKQIDDSLKMLEQILPYFKPHYNVSVNTLPDLGIIQDIPIVLHNIQLDDNYLADFKEERLVMNTLQFTMKTNLFGPVSGVGVIKNADVYLHSNLQGIPCMTDHYNCYVNPLTANETDAHTIHESLELIWSDL
jgi:hypothetical protein